MDILSAVFDLVLFSHGHTLLLQGLWECLVGNSLLERIVGLWLNIQKCYLDILCNLHFFDCLEIVFLFN